MTTTKQLIKIRDGFQSFAIDPLEKLIASGKYKGHVDMFRGEDFTNPDCGTVACFGGWLAIANEILGEEAEKYNLAWDYLDGAKFLEIKMGFEEWHGLSIWMREHPEVWGNKYGSSMFVFAESYGCDDETITLPIIVNHLKGVVSRLTALIDKQQKLKVEE